MAKKKVSDALNEEQSKAVVTAETTAVAPRTTQADLAAWGVHESMLTSKDIQIPKILPMQAMSKLVTNGDAKFGEFRESLDNRVLGDLNSPLEFVPFFMEKCYVVMRLKEGKFRWNRSVPIVPANEDHPFEAQSEDGHAEKWYRTMNFYVLLPDEVKKGCAIPYVLSFRSSSARAGQKLTTRMYVKNLQAGATPASMAMKLLGTKTTNDKGTFVVLDVETLRESTEQEVAECFDWVKKIRGGNVKVDQSDLEQEATERATAQAAPDSSDY
jgi:hypothetical protein